MRKSSNGRDQLKCDGTRAETRFRLSVKRTSPFKSAGASVQSITGSRGVRISGSNAGYTMFWGSVKGTGYPLHLPVSPSLPLPCFTVCHHISTGVHELEHFGLPSQASYRWAVQNNETGGEKKKLNKSRFKLISAGEGIVQTVTSHGGVNGPSLQWLPRSPGRR